MSMLPIYELKINEEVDDKAEVSAVALVDEPAIQRDFLAFREQFIEPSKGEHQDEFLPRCISYLIKEGKDSDQAVAICNSIWDAHFADASCPIATQDIAINLKNRQNAINVAHYGPLNPNLPSEDYWIQKGKQFNTTSEVAKQSRCANCSFFNVSQKIKDCIAQGIGNELDPYNVINAGDLGYCEAFDFKCASQRTCDAWVVGGPIKFAESYNDYPKKASENAKIALRWAEENGWGDCGTPVGKIRANQLANNEPISRDTIARMSAFERHRQNSQKELGDGCGRLMWLAWGGDEGIEWATRKLQQIDKETMAGGVSFDFDGVLTTKKGVDLLDAAVSRGTEVYIISARSDDSGLKEFASKHNVKISNVFATGSNKAKIEKIKEIQVSKHYDNNPDVIKELGRIGEKFSFFGFQIVNEDEHIVTGPLMIADEKIYRNNEIMGEHYVVFSADTIKKIAIKFNKKKYQDSVNLMHDPAQIVEGVTMFESWIVDSKRGVKPMAGFEDVAEGSWFGSFYVENQDVWNRVKSGEFKGFSVEGNFDYAEPEPPKTSEEMMLEKINKLLNEIITD